MNQFIKIFSILLFAACSSISRKDCELGEWQMLGEKDGLSGRGESRVLKYIKDCKSYNVSLDKAQYLKGLHIGLIQYCYKKGVQDGENGKVNSIPNQCLKHQEKYNIGNKEGIKIFCTIDKAASNGSRGKSFNVDACPSLDRNRLDRAYKRELEKYCQPARAYSAGERNESLELSRCPQITRDAFEAGKDIEEIHAKSKKLKKEIRDLRRESYNPSLSREGRNSILDSILDREEKLEDLMDENRRIERRFRSFY